MELYTFLNERITNWVDLRFRITNSIGSPVLVSVFNTPDGRQMGMYNMGFSQVRPYSTRGLLYAGCLEDGDYLNFDSCEDVRFDIFLRSESHSSQEKDCYVRVISNMLSRAHGNFIFRRDYDGVDERNLFCRSV